MSLEAAAGKNPVSHVGKIYNVLATRIAEALVTALPEVSEAHCLIVSNIGAPISEPVLVQAKLAEKSGVALGQLKSRTEEVVASYLAQLPEVLAELASGRAQLF